MGYQHTGDAGPRGVSMILVIMFFSKTLWGGHFRNMHGLCLDTPQDTFVSFFFIILESWFGVEGKYLKTKKVEIEKIK